MSEQQAAGLVALFWTPTGGSTETLLGEVPQAGSNILNIEETQIYFNTLYAGNNPTEARVQTGPVTYTVDLIESATIRALLSNTHATEGTKVVGGLNNGKPSITGQLRIHPMFAGIDNSNDITLLKCSVNITDERSNTEDGQKLYKCIFTAMGVKTTLATPVEGTDFTVAGGSAATSYIKMVNANDLGVSIASGAETGKEDSTITFTSGTGTTRIIFWRASNAGFSADVEYYEATEGEIEIGTVVAGSVSWTAATAGDVPASATGYYYKVYQIGE